MPQPVMYTVSVVTYRKRCQVDRVFSGVHVFDGLFVRSFVSLFVCLSFFHIMSQKPMHLGLPNLA